jgi:hypothetical protein
MEMNLERDTARSMSPAAVGAGAILLVLGLAMLLTPAENLRLDTGRLIGPFMMIAIGTTMLLGGRGCAAHRPADEATGPRRRGARRERSTGGLWLIGIGCWLLVSQTGLFGLGFSTSWPLLLIAMGLLLAIRGWR